MTYDESVKYLFGIRMFGIKLGLENIRALLEMLGNPQDSLRFIHIAGTNGKGSVAAMLNAIGQAAGLRVGLYTSPHLVSFCDRIQVNDRSIAQTDVSRLVENIRPLMELVAAMPERAHPTFFEAVTALALCYFREQRCDLVVWETGMGGRLDATNVVTPLVSVITNVQMDHAAYLGDTLEKIAGEKSGIIKPSVPVVTAADEPVVLKVIERVADETGAPVVRIRREDCASLAENDQVQTVRIPNMEAIIPLLGPVQAVNAATAAAAARIALKCSDDSIRTGLAQTKWPGRFQIIPGKPTLVLDGAHNPAAAKALRTALERHFPNRSITLVLGILRDKNYEEFCRILVPCANRVLTVRVQSERTSEPEDIAALCRRITPEMRVENAKTLSAAIETMRGNDGVVVVAGSLFLVGETLSILEERRLESGLNQ